MTGRERVLKALNFQAADRIPRDLWVLPYSSLYRQDEVDTMLARYPIDFERVESYPGATEAETKRLATPGTYVDDWGSTWQVGVPGTIGEVKEPAIEDWARLPAWQPPWRQIKRRDIDYVNRLCDATDCFTINPVSARPFERLQFLRGTENVYLDLASGSSEFTQLLDLVHAFYIEDVRSWASSNVDGVFLMDDWGTQESMLISPKMWRETFKPLYKDYFDIIHAAGKHVFFHSDGFIEPIIEDLIEVGADALNSQLFCMDIEGLGTRFGGRITFWGEIDRQYVLPFGTREDVFEAVRRVQAALDKGRGGVIAQCEWGKDNELPNVEAVYEAWLD
ncbi:MAG TPA: uroporphyrinogen decarboxylase family protein [Rhodothermales bacterium]